MLQRVSNGDSSAADAASTWSAQQLVQQPQAEGTQETKYNDYSFQATFNSKNGRFDFAGGQSYFERNNIPTDKDGRQMSNFFNLDNLQQNREEYLRKKK